MRRRSRWFVRRLEESRGLGRGGIFDELDGVGGGRGSEFAEHGGEFEFCEELAAGFEVEGLGFHGGQVEG